MSRIKIVDLEKSKELDSQALREIVGGRSAYHTSSWNHLKSAEQTSAQSRGKTAGAPGRRWQRSS